MLFRSQATAATDTTVVTTTSQAEAQDLQEGYESAPVNTTGTIGTAVGDQNSTSGTDVSPQPKAPIITAVVPNPLHKYASYTYATSLWWLSLDDYETLATSTDIDSALAWEPGPNSYVVAEDAGLYPNRRIPGVLPVNYNIQSIDIKTQVSPTQTSRSSNILDRKSTRLNSSHIHLSRMPSSA